MKQKILFQGFTSDLPSYQVEADLPDRCPFCLQGNSSKAIAGYHTVFVESQESIQRNASAIILCPGCDRYYFASYSLVALDASAHLEGVFPSPGLTAFSSRIGAMSSNFVETFAESELAEASGMYRVCGPGYRKALEYLVKDYAILLHPDQAVQIRQETLAACISNYVDNSKIKELARASSWLGNDQVHYEPRNTSYSLSDMKAFILATAYYVECELALREARRLLDGR